MENDQLVNSGSENGLRLAQEASAAASKAITGNRALIFNAIFCVFVLLGVINLSLIVALTRQGQVLFFGGHTPYLENMIYFSTSLALILAGIFGLKKAK